MKECTFTMTPYYYSMALSTRFNSSSSLINLLNRQSFLSFSKALSPRSGLSYHAANTLFDILNSLSKTLYFLLSTAGTGSSLERARNRCVNKLFSCSTLQKWLPGFTISMYTQGSFFKLKFSSRLGILKSIKYCSHLSFHFQQQL